jgi:hypothetical protein
MRRIVLALSALVGLAIVWWLASPLFLNETVDEDFPTTSSLAPDVDPAELLGDDAVLPEGMSEPEAAATMASAAAVDQTASEGMGEMATAIMVASGGFRDVDAIHRGSGEATIYQLQDGSGDYVLRLEDLAVTNGPDLVVTLSGHPDPTSSDELHEGFVELASLKGNLGNQNYELPDDFDPATVESVAIYCRAFGVLFSVAPLTSFQ